MKLCWVLAAAACGSTSHTPIKPGDDHDEGAGILARASTQLMTGDPTPDRLADTSRPVRRGAEYGGIEYGGGMYGGDPYGGTSYAHWTLPAWNVQPPNRVPRYTIATTGLDGAIEGTITWTGAVPGKLATACGTIDNPLHVGVNRELRDAIIYIERVTTGRAVPVFQRPLAVGGSVAKHGCTLQPTAQIAIPTPTSVTVHGDQHRTRVRITPSGAAPKLFELQEGGLAQSELKSGVTKVDGEDGKLVAAWIVGLDTPYYAISDDTGHYRIDSLAAGSYEVTFWVPPIATAGPDGTIVYGAPTIVRRSVRVDAVKPAQLSIALPSR